MRAKLFALMAFVVGLAAVGCGPTPTSGGTSKSTTAKTEMGTGSTTKMTETKATEAKPTTAATEAKPTTAATEAKPTTAAPTEAKPTTAAPTETKPTK